MGWFKVIFEDRKYLFYMGTHAKAPLAFCVQLLLISAIHLNHYIPNILERQKGYLIYDKGFAYWRICTRRCRYLY